MKERNLMREVRDALGYTQEEMAQAVLSSLSTVVKCENENRLPRGKAIRENFARLAARAGVSLEEAAEQ